MKTMTGLFLGLIVSIVIITMGGPVVRTQAQEPAASTYQMVEVPTRGCLPVPKCQYTYLEEFLNDWNTRGYDIVWVKPLDRGQYYPNTFLFKHR